MHICKNKKH